MKLVIDTRYTEVYIQPYDMDDLKQRLMGKKSNSDGRGCIWLVIGLIMAGICLMLALMGWEDAQVFLIIGFILGIVLIRLGLYKLGGR